MSRSVTRATSTTTAASRLGQVDLLRFVAALLVVVYHYTFAGKALGHVDLTFPSGLTAFTRYGYLGVQLFFFISGFVVLMSAWKRTGSQFAVSRIVRLYPAYWIGVLLSSAVILAAGTPQSGASRIDGTELTGGQILVNLTMFQSFFGVEHVDGVYWTLARELSFYLLILLLIVTVGLSWKSVTIFMWSWLAICAVVPPLELTGPAGYLVDRFLMPDYAPFFIAGMALFLVHRLGWRAHTVALCSASYVASMIATVHEVGGVREITQSHINPVIATSIVTVWYGVLLLIASRKPATDNNPAPGAVQRLGSLGKLTYPLYLIHSAIGLVIFDKLYQHLNRWVLLLAVTAVMLAIAWAIERWVERPGQRALRQLLTR